MEQDIIATFGPMQLSRSLLTSAAIVIGLALLAGLSTRRLDVRPNPWQTITESIVVTIEEAIRSVAPKQVRQILPFIATLWIFLVIANLISLIPGLHSPTEDISVTSALAVLVFFSVHWFGIKDQGIKNYLKHYLMPSPLLLPFHIISEFTRTLALAIRLFGNMMSLEMAALLILLVAGFLAPIPILMLHIIEALVQAYIFGMLALVYIAGAMQSQHLKSRE
jgi:F-type H+-transporting ATPase subunit a